MFRTVPAPAPVVLAAALGLALVTAACGGGSSSAAGTASAASTAPAAGASPVSSAYVADKLALAQCLRAHGIPNYPDPNAEGQEPPDSKQLITTTQGQAAVGACIPVSSRVHGDVAAENQVVMAEYLRFAQCMRSSGLPEFPDPTYSQTEGRVEFLLSSSQDGFDPHSPQVLAKARACVRVLPAGSSLPSVQVTS